MLTRSLAQDTKWFEELLLSFNRQGSDDLLSWLHTTDFFTAPASTRFHESYKGGLVEHSLRVYLELIKLVNMYADKTLCDSVIICGLLQGELLFRDNKKCQEKWGVVNRTIL